MTTTTVKAVSRIAFSNATLRAMGRPEGSYVEPGETFPCPDDQLSWLKQANAIASVKARTAAEAAQSVPAPADTEDDETADAEIDLAAMTRAQLIALGKTLGLTLAKNLKPETMVSKIELAMEEREDDTGDDEDEDNLV